MLRRIWDRLARLWRPIPCTTCGRPSTGFVAEMNGKLLTRNTSGEPVTKYYVSGTRSACKECLDAFGAELARKRAERDE